MHNALSYTRLHNPKTRIIGIYCPTGYLVPPHILNEQKDENIEEEDESIAQPNKSKDIKYGIGGDACVCVPNPRGQFFKNMGRADRWNREWLLPEEALYMLERGSLDIRWPANRDEDEIETFDSSNLDDTIPMSLQAAYACFMGRGGLTMERYTVYAGLKRGGYTVIRAGEPSHHGDSGTESFTIVNTLSRFFSSIFTPQTKCLPVHGPLIGLGIHRSYG